MNKASRAILFVVVVARVFGLNHFLCVFWWRAMLCNEDMGHKIVGVGRGRWMEQFPPAPGTGGLPRQAAPSPAQAPSE